MIDCVKVNKKDVFKKDIKLLIKTNYVWKQAIYSAD